jgi:hypothetical protein
MFSNRLITNPCLNVTDPAAAREKHMKLVTGYQKDPYTLCLYSDGLKINRSGFFSVEAAAVAYHLGNKVVTGQLGLGGHAELFVAAMAALSIAA